MSSECAKKEKVYKKFMNPRVSTHRKRTEEGTTPHRKPLSLILNSSFVIHNFTTSFRSGKVRAGRGGGGRDNPSGARDSFPSRPRGYRRGCRARHPRNRSIRRTPRAPRVSRSGRRVRGRDGGQCVPRGHRRVGRNTAPPPANAG